MAFVGYYKKKEGGVHNQAKPERLCNAQVTNEK